VTAEQARAAFAAARVARLATADLTGQPHLVPIVFALDGDTVYSAIDHKPKRTTALRRLENVRANPRVALLADEYDDADWSALWWVRAEGAARVLEPESDEGRHGIDELVARYAQYRDVRPHGPVLAIAVRRWAGWRALTARRPG
jgi:PPOX class probable F420-dependent enzyme